METRIEKFGGSVANEEAVCSLDPDEWTKRMTAEILANGLPDDHRLFKNPETAAQRPDIGQKADGIEFDGKVFFQKTVPQVCAYNYGSRRA